MSTILKPAKDFFDACETGQGWDACKPYCHPDATFAAQSGVLAEVDTLAGYCDFMKSMYTPVPDGHYDLKFIAADESDRTVAAIATFHGTQTGPRGAEPPTGKKVASDYAYLMQFDGNRIKHMTKVWNDAAALQQLGWI